jgi:hypothetical protein
MGVDVPRLNRLPQDGGYRRAFNIPGGAPYASPLPVREEIFFDGDIQRIKIMSGLRKE